MAVGSDKFASPGALRMALAFAVFVHHTTKFNLGMSAVLIFFVLSGYWVATMWTKTYSKTSLSYFTFLVSRFWRVAPVFMLCSAIAWTLLWWRGVAPAEAGGLMRQLFSNVMILGYNSLSYQANVPGWSLDMEMQFYLVAPVVVFLVSRNIFVLLGCVLLSLLAPKFGGSATVLPFLYFFGIGVAAATHDLKPSRRLAYASLGATFALLAVYAAIFFKSVAADPTQTQLLAFSSKANLLIAVMMTPWAIYTTKQKSGSTDRMFGDLSYIFYLLHWSVIGAIGTGEGSYADRFVLCSEAVIVILVASWLIWLLFDRPIGRLRAGWVARRRVTATAEPGGAALQPALA
jgi:peptidoglycan/LPS O-acetylase OafA/YrhL